MSIRVSIGLLEEKTFADVRIVAPGPDGREIPTKKGVSFRLENLPQLIAMLRMCELEARTRGLIHDEPRAAA
jgi:hypothetical protein